MTTCVAALCAERKAIILVADRLIGYGFVESEPDVRKILKLHPNWRVMIAGNDIDPVFEIVEHAKEKLANIPTPSLETVSAETFQAYKDARRAIAESKFISPRGVTLEAFVKEGRKWVPESDYLERLTQVDQYDLSLEIIVAGFDGDGIGYIFSVEGDDNRGYPRLHDLGFYAIGSGSTNATFFMAQRNVSPKMSVREALYFALEGKYWGEEATGVGEDTDIHVLRSGVDDLILDLDTIEDRLIPICHALRPRSLYDFSSHLRTLNELEELKEFPPIPPKKTLSQKAKAKKPEANKVAIK